MLTRATHIVHTWIRALVSEGDQVVDATCGNGHDTVLLASCCGPTGRVWALDIQEDAVEQTRQRLESDGHVKGVEMHCRSHAEWHQLPGAEGPLRCVVFNLGYLPGSDKQITTQAGSTVAAHAQFLPFLAPGGAIFTTVYVGHEGGPEEAAALLDWATHLDPGQWSVARHAWINQPETAPFILIIQRRN